MFVKVGLIICTSFVLSSCLKQQESITPIAPATTIAELQREAMMRTAEDAGHSELSEEARATLAMSPDPRIFYLNIKYNLNNIDVFQAASMPNSFEALGHSFLQMAAKFVLAVAGPRNIDINDINLTIPPSMDLDRSVVKSIKVKRIFLQYNKELDQASDFAADFSFINTLELSREVTVPNVGKVNTLFLSYRKERNFCMYKCIQFDVLEDNLIDMLKPNSNIKLKPSLSIGKLPAINQLALDGQVEIQIGLSLPF
jgi:hypothetical protein